MAINDLLQNRFTQIIGTLAALAVPMYACEGDSTTNENYYGEGGSSNGVYNCETFCKFARDMCLLPEVDPQNYLSQCINDCEENAPTYDPTSCFSCAKSYNGTQKERCGALEQCNKNNCGDFY